MKALRKRRLRRSGLILRLIDVVFILLFGFISVSEIDKQSLIILPKSDMVEQTVPDKERIVFIGVLPTGKFLVEDETATISEIPTLRKYIEETKKLFRESGFKLKIRIRANHNSSVKYAFSIIQICQDMDIPVAMDVIRV